MKHTGAGHTYIHTLSQQNAGSLNVNVGDTLCHHWSLNGLIFKENPRYSYTNKIRYAMKKKKQLGVCKPKRKICSYCVCHVDVRETGNTTPHILN